MATEGCLDSIMSTRDAEQRAEKWGETEYRLARGRREDCFVQALEPGDMGIVYPCQESLKRRDGQSSI